MCNDFWKSVRREFWCFLRAKGFPIGEVDLQRHHRFVINESVRGKRLQLKEWCFAEGALHGDDVAVVSALAEKLGLRLGVDWDWGLEADDYHFEVAYRKSPVINELFRLLDLYHDANMVLLRVYGRLNGQQSSHEELQRLFAEEWEAWRSEKQRKEQQFMKEFEKALNKILEAKKN